jgi:hypothetical protein
MTTRNSSVPTIPTQSDHPVGPLPIALAWLWVIAPFTYGVWQLLAKVPQLFSG